VSSDLARFRRMCVGRLEAESGRPVSAGGIGRDEARRSDDELRTSSSASAAEAAGEQARRRASGRVPVAQAVRRGDVQAEAGIPTAVPAAGRLSELWSCDGQPADLPKGQYILSLLHATVRINQQTFELTVRWSYVVILVLASPHGTPEQGQFQGGRGAAPQ